MKIKDEKVFTEWEKKNTDSYGSCIFRYVRRWADLMEDKIQKCYTFYNQCPEETIMNVAEITSKEADIEGITGYMYGAAVSILAQCWEYGDTLKKWHNKQYNYNGDGVVNPAILHVGKEG